MSDPSTVSASAEFGMSSNTQQILTYMDDTSMQRASLPGLTTPLAPVIASGHEMRKHTIEDILARPVKVGSAVWIPSQAPNDNIATVVFPDALLNKPQVSSKMQNFTLLRADICVRILVNAMPFQAGKLLSYFSPLSKFVGDRATANNFLSSKCVFPHVLIDAAVGNVAELRIPYVNPYNHYNLTTAFNEMGTLYVDVFNAIRSGSPPAVPVTIFAWFENIDLGVPTAAALVIPPATMVAQVFTEQEDKSRDGIVTDVTGKFAAFSESAERIPIIGNIFEPVTWISKAISKTASMFGLCKPSSVSAPSKYLNVPGSGYTHGEGISESNVLAVKADNQLQMRNDVFGSNVDEMDISYICNHMTLQDQGTWNVASPDKLLEFFVSPMNLKPLITTIATVDYTYYEPTMLGYMAAAFEFWRGSLKYKIQVAKTAFHSGRLRISYIPGANLGETYDYDLAYSWVLDLRVSNQIEFEVPYTGVLPWLPTAIPTTNIGAENAVNGILVISVLNPLIAPTTVDATVDFNVWVGAGSDFQLSRPSVNKYIPISLPVVLEAQVGEETQDAGFIDFKPAAKMFSMDTSDPISMSALSIGEHVTNIRTIIKRSAIKFFGSFIKPKNSLSVNAQDLGQLTQIDQQSSSQVYTPLDYFSYIYRFYRGGLDWKVFSRNSNFLYTVNATKAVVRDEAQIRSTITALVANSEDGVFLSNGVIDFKDFDGGAFTHTTFTQLNPIHEVVAPHYLSASMVPVWGANTDFSDLPLLTYKELIVAYESSLDADPDIGSRTRIEMWKAAADDFQFGWLVGPPRIARYTGVVQDSWTPSA